ncbi:MAG: long-chain fatty acid--CoA ligase [Candidatus Methanomethylicia archaeon]
MTWEKPWFKFYPVGISKEAKIPEVRLDELLKKTAQEFPGRVFLRFMGVKFTFRYVDELVDRFTTALADLGVKKGSVIAIMLPNCPQFAIAYYGALRAGAIVTTLNPLYTAREVEFQLNDSESEILIVLDVLYTSIIRDIKNKTFIKKIIITNIADFLPPLKRMLGKFLKKIPQAKVEAAPDIYLLMNLIKKYRPNPPKVDINVKDDVAVLLYTGGTTGTPKGAMLTHYNMVANAIQCNLWSGTRTGAEVLIGVLPWYHVYGQTVVLNSAAAMGGTVIVYPRFDVEEIMRGIQENKATLFPAVATIYNAINNHPSVKKYSLSSLRAGISGAGPLPLSIQETFEKLTGALICEGYGLTEAAPVTHCNPLNPELRKVGSIGIPLPSTDAGIMHIEKNEFLKPGEEGEIVVSGPQVMKGYWRKPEETRKTLIVMNGKIWLRTGDIGKMDEDGFFYVIDRKKELIKYKGWSIYPREVEEVLFSHEAVKDAAVVGIPDPSVGEWIKAYVVLKDEYKGKVTVNDLIEWCKKNLAPYKIPKEIEFRDQLPRTIVGKLLRRLLRDEEIAKRRTTT